MWSRIGTRVQPRQEQRASFKIERRVLYYFMVAEVLRDTRGVVNPE